MPSGWFQFGTASLEEGSDDDHERGQEREHDAPKAVCPCTVGCLLDIGAGEMTVFVDGEPLEQQCQYKFPCDGREWFPTVSLKLEGDDLVSNAV